MRRQANEPAVSPPTYPVVDVFAGPGGLGEGFSALRGNSDQRRFRNVASIERDEFSHRTLLLRHFVRGFNQDEIPDDYYSYLKGEIKLKELFSRHKPRFIAAQNSALRVTLGAGNHAKVKQLVKQRLDDASRWVLVGGPPCQAYSLVGRSRMMSDPDFEKDERHFLFQEYLRLIVDHSPPVFVMENVKGLLSATIGDEPIIKRIVADLSQPNAALNDRTNGLSYRLYSLSEAETPSGDVEPRHFLVRAEEYGVPQARHRMFIVGVRSDIHVRPQATPSSAFPNSEGDDRKPSKDPQRPVAR